MNFKWDLKSCLKKKKQQQTTNAVLRKRSKTQSQDLKRPKTLLLRIQDPTYIKKGGYNLFYLLHTLTTYAQLLAIFLVDCDF